MTTDTATYDFHRDFTISTAQLWHLLTDPGMRSQWGTPEPGQTLTMITSDLRTGGLERHRCGPADAPEFEVETRWYRLDASENAVFTETLEADGATLATSLVTYRLTETGAGTALDVSVAVSSFVGPDMAQEFHAGWEGGLDNLARLAMDRAA